MEQEEFIKRFREMCVALLDNEKIMGFCYTQLTDVEQEQNGFYNYDRSDKLTDEQKIKIRELNGLLK